MVIWQVKVGKHSGPYFCQEEWQEGFHLGLQPDLQGLPYAAARVEGSLVLSKGGHQGLQLPLIPALWLDSTRHKQADPVSRHKQDKPVALEGGHKGDSGQTTLLSGILVSAVHAAYQGLVPEQPLRRPRLFGGWQQGTHPPAGHI